MVTPAACREAAAHLREGFAMSERRACRVAGVDRSSVRYRRRRPEDGPLRERLKELAAQRRRFGYRRLWVLLRRDGHAVNKKRVYRLYRQERLMVRRRGGRKRAVGTRSPMPVPSGPNRRWSLDFVHDQMTDGRRLRILAVVDDGTRECLALMADTSISGVRVARELDRIVARRGRPGGIVSDNVLSRDARALLRQQVSFAGVTPVDQYSAFQVASTAERIALSHSKHRVHHAVALTVLKTRCAIQVEDPNIIYRVEAFATPSRLYRGRVLPLGTGPSWKGR
jgi:transposase InsO family protein